MRAMVDVVVFPGDDHEFQVVAVVTGPTVKVGDLNITWLGAHGPERAAATLRRLADEIEAGQ